MLKQSHPFQAHSFKRRMENEVTTIIKYPA